MSSNEKLDLAGERPTSSLLAAIYKTSTRGAALNTAEWKRIEGIIALCREARDRLEHDAPFRLRVLLDMALLELGRELARLSGDRAA